MGVEVFAVGGYGEVGRNMTAIRVDDQVVILDMGLHMPNYIKLTEEEIGEIVKINESALKKVDAVPQDNLIKDWRQNVVAIVLSHAHLDHIGAVPYLASKYDAPIICTPFTAEVLKSICKDENIRLPNKIVPLYPNQRTTIGDNLVFEFCAITHSTPQDVLITLHTRHGTIVYGNDYKLDDHPGIGKKPDYEHFRKLGEKGVLLLIQDCLYAPEARKTPSEAVAKDMLDDVLLGVDSTGKAVIVTTFASHIARLKAIAEYGKKLGRKVVFMGRSIAKYARAAEAAGIAKFEGVEILKYRRQIEKKLKEIQARGREKFLMVMSGHQGEPKSALARIIRGELHFKFKAGDHVVFSCIVIPAEINRKNRAEMDEQLRSLGVRIFSDIHVSGHSSREDIRDMIMLLKPKHLIPTHGEPHRIDSFIALAEEIGYKHDKIHGIITGQKIQIV
ncbi:MAG: MBL fold metallo-hydrolase RNA specificity domain-containing protein [Candidatus Woesearchaeota archaeon]